MLSLLARHWKIAAAALALLLFSAYAFLSAPPTIPLTAENLHGTWFHELHVRYTFIPPNRYLYAAPDMDTGRSWCGYFSIIDGKTLALRPDPNDWGAGPISHQATLSAEGLRLGHPKRGDRYRRYEEVPTAISCRVASVVQPPVPTSTPRPYPIPTPTPRPGYPPPFPPTPR